MKFTLFNLFKKKAADVPPQTDPNAQQTDPNAQQKDPQAYSLDPKEVRDKIVQRLTALLTTPNFLERHELDTIVPQGVDPKALVNPEFIQTYMATEAAPVIDSLFQKYESLDPKHYTVSLQKFLDESSQPIVDAVSGIWPKYKEEAIKHAGAAGRTEGTPKEEQARLFSTQVKATAEGLIVEAQKYIAQPENEGVFGDLNDYQKNAIIAEFSNTLEGDMRDALPQAIKTFMLNTPGYPKDAVDFGKLSAPYIFQSNYETVLWESAAKMTDMAQKDPQALKEELKAKFGMLKEEMGKKTGVQEKDIYYIKEGSNVKFTETGKGAFLNLWSANVDGSPNAILNQFVGAVQQASPDAAKAHDNQMDVTNFQGLLDDMTILANAQRSGHRAAFGTNAEPLLTFLVKVAKGAYQDIQKFDVTRPEAHGRDTDIQAALDRMTARGLFPTIKPDLKSEKWTLTINPGPTFSAAKAFASSLTTDLKDVLMVFAARPDMDSFLGKNLAPALNKLIKAWDKYALDHLENLDVQSLAEGYGAKITEEVMKALEGNNTPTPPPSGGGTPPPPPIPKQAPTATPVAYSLRSMVKLGEGSQGQSLVGEIMKRYHGIPVGDKVEAFITERNIPPFPVTVYEIEIEGAYLKNLPQVQLMDMNKVLTGEALGQYQAIKPGVYLVHASFDYVNGKPAYIVVLAVGEPAKDVDVSQVKDPVVQQILSSKGSVEDALDDETTLRQLAQHIGTQGNIPALDKSQIRNQIEELERSMAGGADQKITQDKIKQLQKQLQQPDNKETLGIKQDEIYSMDPDQLRGVVEKYLNNFSRTNSYAVDYDGMKKVNRTPAQDKVSRDIVNTIYDLKDRSALTRGDATLPPEMTQKVLDTLVGIQTDLQKAGVPTMGAQDANRTMASLTKAALAGDIKSLSYVHDQLKTYLTQLDTFLKERGGGREAPFVKQLLDKYVLPLAQTFSEGSDLNKTMLTIGKLENYLDDLNAGTFTDKAVAPIADELAKVKEQYNIKGAVDPNELTLDQTTQAIFDALQEGAEYGEPTMQDASGPVYPEAPKDKSELVSEKIEEKKPNKKNFKIQTLGKNFDKLRPLFEARAKETAFEIDDADQTLQSLDQLLTAGEQNGTTVNVQEGPIPPPKSKGSPPAPPLTPEQQEELKRVTEQQRLREKQHKKQQEEGIMSKQLSVKTLRDKAMSLDKEITNLLQGAFEALSRKYPDVAERNQAVSSYRVITSQIEQERADVMRRVTEAVSGLNERGTDEELTAAIQELEAIKKKALQYLS